MLYPFSHEQVIELTKEVFKIERNTLEDVENSLLSTGFHEALECILNSKGRVVVCGMGKSGLIGRKIQATLASTGTASFFLHPAEAYHGDLGMVRPEDVILCLSSSGETEEVVKILSFFKENQNKTIALTCNKESTLAKYCDILLFMDVKKEACPLELAPTSSTTATLVAGDALAVCLMKAKAFMPEDFARFHPGGSLGKRLLNKVKDFTQTDSLSWVQLESDLKSVIDRISSSRVGMCIVGDAKKMTVEGVITDGDLRRFLDKHGADSFNHQAKDLMTVDPLSIDANKNLFEAEEFMNMKKVSVLLVREDQNFIGLLHRFQLNNH